MDKSAILRLFLTQGVQIDKVALDFLVETPILVERVLNSVKSKLPPVITLEFLNTLDIKPTEKQTSVNQLSQTLNYRYEFLRGLISEKEELINLISINKINEKIKEFSVIGIVFEKNDYLTLEDNTGQATFQIDGELSKYLVEDEVVGFVCERHFGNNEVRNVVYPDIPFKKENNKTKNPENWFFVSDINIGSESNIKYYKNLLNWLEEQKNLKIFILGEISGNTDDVNKFLADIHHPIQIYSKSQINKSATIKAENVEVMLADGSFIENYSNQWGTQLDTTITNLIKKRNLNPILTPDSYNNSSLLENVPDILLLSGTNKVVSTTYKGTTILTLCNLTTEPIYWLINLQTRETFKIDLS